MPDVFISYSRRNLDFVQRLSDALIARGKEVCFDQIKEPLQGLTPASRWWGEIKYGIETADNFLFIISSDSIVSPYCNAEIAYALARERRIVTVLICAHTSQADAFRAVDEAIEDIPEDTELPSTVSAGITNLRSLTRRNWLKISQIQYVAFQEDEDFQRLLELLLQGLDLDLAWARMWSQFRQTTQIWVETGDDSYLWSEERMKPFREMVEEHGQELTDSEREFLRPEQEHLVAELATNIDHIRRNAIGMRLHAIGDTRPGVGLVTAPLPPLTDPREARFWGEEHEGLPDIVWLPVQGGRVTLEKGIGTFPVGPFYIAKYPITYIQFQAFIDAEDGFRAPAWWQGWVADADCQSIPGDQRFTFLNHPREMVSWYDAVAFTCWLNTKVALTLNPSPSGRGTSEGEERYREMAIKAMRDAARHLRQNQTDAEAALWECLRDRRLGSLNFRRQHPVANTHYVVDFLSYESRLIVEIDGPVHNKQQEEDARRQRDLEALGYRVIRFKNEAVFSDLEAVLAAILRSSSPLPEGAGAGVRANWQIRLPTEWEWQRAAQGGDRREYPWGREWDGARANTTECGLNKTTAVGMYPAGKAPHGALDMSGNVWEWCLNESRNPENTSLDANVVRVLRGGSWLYNRGGARCTARTSFFPSSRYDNIGFRVAVARPPSTL